MTPHVPMLSEDIPHIPGIHTPAKGTMPCPRPWMDLTPTHLPGMRVPKPTPSEPASVPSHSNSQYLLGRDWKWFACYVKRYKEGYVGKAEPAELNPQGQAPPPGLPGQHHLSHHRPSLWKTLGPHGQ